MLLFARKLGESIIITAGNDEIRVVITELDKNIAKVGIDAPRHIRIDREEVHLMIKSDKCGNK